MTSIRTVGELRAAIKDLPDDRPVFYYDDVLMGDVRAQVIIKTTETGYTLTVLSDFSKHPGVQY